MTDTATAHGDMFDDGLFTIDREPTAFLRDRYLEPPFTILDRRSGTWQARDRAWKALGIQSEVGRDQALTYNMNMTYAHADPDASTSTVPQSSVFSPTLTELLVRWYSRQGDLVLDPFAGGSVRGVVATALERDYVGIELRPEQVASNQTQAHLHGGARRPVWIEGDASHIVDLVSPHRADMVLSCPPYTFLEQYSDDPRDLSSMSYPDFLEAYRQIIARTVSLLRDDRFVAWTVGEVRHRSGDGSLVGLIPDTVQAFRDAGCRPYNDHILATPVGTAAVRTPKQFDASRKAGRIHEYVLVFVKGDARRATQRLGAVS